MRLFRPVLAAALVKNTRFWLPSLVAMIRRWTNVFISGYSKKKLSAVINGPDTIVSARRTRPIVSIAAYRFSGAPPAAAGAPAGYADVPSHISLRAAKS